MKPVLSTKYAEAKRRATQRLSDFAAEALFSDARAGAVRCEPVARNAEYWASELWIYEEPEDRLVAAGLIQAEDLPGRAAGCRLKRKAGRDFLATYRMADGRVRLTLSAHLARGCDAGFVDFMAKAVAGTLVDRISKAPPSNG